MCLIISGKNLAEKISDELLKDILSKNPDGFGLMFSSRNTLVVEKGLFSQAEIRKLLSRIPPDIKIAVHFRMQTHGDIVPENAHPFRVLDNLYLMHNGILACGNASDPTKTDTEHFIEALRPYLEANPGVWKTPEFQKDLELAIGSSNKFVLVDEKSSPILINEKAGVRYKDLWMSNTYAWDYYRFAERPKVVWPEWGRECNILKIREGMMAGREGGMPVKPARKKPKQRSFAFER